MASGLTTSGFEALEAMLAKAAERSQDLTPVWLDFGEEMILQTQLRAAGGIAPDGSPWPVSARAAGMSGQTLEHSGKLIASVTYGYEPHDFLLFSDDIRAAVHQEGKTIYPKAGHRALAIPMSEKIANRYQAGVSIHDQYPDAFLMRSAIGNMFLVRRTAPTGDQLDKAARSGRAPAGKFGELEFLFMLVSSVTEPERRFIGYGGADIAWFEGRVVKHYGMFDSGGSA
jgi:phage gpG-like protein